MVAARDERDALAGTVRGARERRARSHVRVVGKVPRRSDGHDGDLGRAAAAHEPDGNEHGPVERVGRGRGIVRAIAHRHDRDAGGANRVAHPEREVSVDGDP